MKIQYASDLHLEFHDNSRWLKANPLIPVGDVLILAGDIGYLGDEMYSRHPFWTWCFDNFKDTIIIPGNHELYKGYDINALKTGTEIKIRPNVRLVYNKVIALNETTNLIASTLWSQIKMSEAYWVESGVSDFHRIKDGENCLSWRRFNEEHEVCKAFIRDSVLESYTQSKKVIVSTHHVPSFRLMADEFKVSRINGAFTSDLDNFTSDLPINYWIYGHSHRNINCQIGNTSFITNQLGYVFLNEHRYFVPDKHIDI